MVELDQVHKRFGTKQVLRGVSFYVTKGEMVAIIGKSGSGKSTALRCIDRSRPSTAAAIEVCGHACRRRERSMCAKLRREVGIVFQSYNLFPHLTVEQNIMLGLHHVKRLGK